MMAEAEAAREERDADAVDAADAADASGPCTPAPALAPGAAHDVTTSPFVDAPGSPQRIGHARLHLEALGYLLPVEDESISVLDFRGRRVGALVVAVEPTVAAAPGTDGDDAEGGAEPQHVMDVVGRPLQLTVSILSAQGVPAGLGKNVFVRFTPPLAAAGDVRTARAVSAYAAGPSGPTVDREFDYVGTVKVDAVTSAHVEELCSGNTLFELWGSPL